MVREVLRALEHLRFAEPAHRLPVLIEELEESATSPTLPRLSAASLSALVLRRHREIDAVRAGSASATALVGAAAIEAGGLRAASTSTEEPVEADYEPPTMVECWATVEQQFEEAHAARRQARALEDTALASWDRYLEDFHCGREITGERRKGGQARRRGEPRRGSRGDAGSTTRGGGEAAAAGGPPSHSQDGSHDAAGGSVLVPPPLLLLRLLGSFRRPELP